MRLTCRPFAVNAKKYIARFERTHAHFAYLNGDTHPHVYKVNRYRVVMVLVILLAGSVRANAVQCLRAGQPTLDRV